MLYAAIGAAGAIGACLRYAVTAFFFSFNATSFPVATLLCNLSGSFVLAWLYAIFPARDGFYSIMKTALGVGLLGSFTTFSAFSFETLYMLQHKLWFFATLYIAMTLLGGLLCSAIGMRVGGRACKPVIQVSKRGKS